MAKTFQKLQVVRVMKMIYKVSVERCIACGKCELACAFAHGAEGRPSKTRINIFRRGPELGTPIVCFQCDDAACAKVCPTEALVRNAGNRSHRHGAVAMHHLPHVCRRLSVRKHVVGRDLSLRPEMRPVRWRPAVRALLSDRGDRLGASRGGGDPTGTVGPGERFHSRAGSSTGAETETRDMTQEIDEIHEILRKAYQIEVDGYTFYSMAAERASKPAVQELFDKLARDEVQHKAYLQSVIGSYEEKGLAAFSVPHRDPDLKAFTGTIFTEEFKKQAHGADFELGVLSIGMTLETNAIQYFSGAAQKTSETGR